MATPDQLALYADNTPTFADMLNHPDKLQAIDVSPEIAAFANTRLRRIIDAYNQITLKRHGRQAVTEEPKAYAKT